jgi:hypothetical protein
MKDRNEGTAVNIVKEARPVSIAKDDRQGNSQKSNQVKIGKDQKARKAYPPPDVKGKDGELEQELSSKKRGSPYPPLAETKNRSLNDIKKASAQTGEESASINGWTSFPPLGGQGLSAPSIEITDPAVVTSYEAEAKKNKQIKATKKGMFYYGVLAGLNVSTIKGQEIRKPGYDIGILAGYYFNKHLSLEAGIILSKKKYYTDGKYFNKSKAGLPTYVQINSLDGGCQMFEFPITIHYDFNIRKNSFFAAAGITSEIMNTESYTYNAGTPGWIYERFTKYKHSGNYYFSGLNISAGYNHKISSQISLRIEPYFKIPLKKIGIGEMPITSTGVNFGFMRNRK